MALAKSPDKPDLNEACVSTPSQPKKAQNTPTSARLKSPQNVTPASNVKRAAANSPRTTPRKISGSKPKTPKSAPTRPKIGVTRRVETSLLEDFLLGRPTPHRARKCAPPRRASLEAVKADMKAEFVAKVQAPSKVQDRVKEWQKSSAVAIAEKQDNGPARDNSKNPKGSNQTKIKTKDNEDVSPAMVKPQSKKMGEEISNGRNTPASNQNKYVPKKRVINDSLWMKENGKNISKKGNTLPKNFLKVTAANPPLEKKMQDWMRRTECTSEISHEKQEIYSSNTSEASEDLTDKSTNDGTLKFEPSSNIRAVQSVKKREEGRPIPQKSLKTSAAHENSKKEISDGKRLSTASSRNISDQDVKRKISVKQDLGSKTTGRATKASISESEQPKSERDNSTRCPKSQLSNSSKSTPTKSNGKHMESSRNTSIPEKTQISIKDKREYGKITPSSARHKDTRGGENRTLKSSTSLNEGSFGQSAFVEFDLPLGAEANSLRRPPPKKNPSFAVSKALKRAFNESMRKVHDSAEAPRSNLSQPARIESWLNTTSDPFIDQPNLSSEISDETVSSDQNPDYAVENLSCRETDTEISKGQKSDQDQSSLQNDERDLLAPTVTSKVGKPSTCGEKLPLQSHRDLRKGQTIRHLPTKSGKKTPLKESIISAFQGESAMKMSKPSLVEPTGQNERILTEISFDPLSPSSSQLTEDPLKPCNHRAARKSDYETAEIKSNIPTLPSRRSTPHTSAKPLSTIASVTSSSACSSVSQTESMYTDTTATQDTRRTTPYSSNLSCRTRQSIRKTGSKRKVTKHTDLISILSLPDTTEPGRSDSLRSARSLRTSRKNNSIGSIDDVLIALAEDEAQYMRELDTLVDGVIPVLIRYIFSSNTRELFDTLVHDADDTSFSQPILDMGVALDKLRSQHKRIPLADAHALLLWAENARPIYEEYLFAWRSGFEDVVVNLAPASSHTCTVLDELRRDQNGDLLGEKGEKIFIADLLKKPIVRIKYISRATKNFSQFPNLSHHGLKQLCDDYEALIDLSRRRIKEERARRIDRQAWNVDTTRARNLKTLDPAEKFEINRSYQVTAKDHFSFEMFHSTGQRINCGVELVLRDRPEMNHVGDLLIFKKDNRESFLLFEPIAKQELSARLGETKEQVVVMVRGLVLEKEYTELFVLDAEDQEVAADWVSMLGQTPIPPAVIRTRLKIDPELASVLTTLDTDAASIIGTLKNMESNQVPIGERPKEEYLDLATTRMSALFSHDFKKYRGPVDKLKRCLNAEELASIDQDKILDITAANTILIEKGISPISYVKPDYQTSSYQDYDQALNLFKMSGGLNPYATKFLEESNSFTSEETPSVEDNKLKASSKIFENDSNSFNLAPNSSCREDGAPPPPVHRTPVSEALKNSSIPDLGTPIKRRRRTSSPLKHEYQPSVASSSSSEASSEEDSLSETSSEDDSVYDCDEDDHLTGSFSDHSVDKIPSNTQLLTPLNANIALPQPPLNATLEQNIPAESPPQMFTAVLSQWNGATGQWTSLHSEISTIVVTDGLIECFEIDDSDLNQDSERLPEYAGGIKLGRPIVKQTLTPVVQVRQSTAIDIEIKSAIFTIKESRVSRSALQISDTLRYRLFAPQVCDALYAAIHRSRLRNKTYLRLEEEARIKGFGTNLYDENATSKRQSLFFGLGRKNSYRASTRVNADRSVKGTISTISALRRKSGTGLFNISRSSVEKDRNSSSASLYNRSAYAGSSFFNNLTPPGTPNSQAGNSDSLYSSGVTVRNLGTSNISFRLYYMLRNGNWLDRGQALLTVSLPPPDMKQKSPLYNGPQKRITITRKPIPVSEDVTGEEIQEAGVLLDEVLGANLFVRMQKSGILLQTWEDVSSNEGNAGVRSFGSVAPRRHIWALQFRRAGDTEWCWQLCRSGVP